VNKLCVHGKEFASHVTASEGWTMVNEGNDIKPKWGFVTRKVREGGGSAAAQAQPRLIASL
jgi:hypothetical protein